MLVGKYVSVIFHSLFVIRNFMGTCSSIEMLKGFIGRVSLESLTYVEAEAVEFSRFRFRFQLPLPASASASTSLVHNTTVTIQWTAK